MRSLHTNRYFAYALMLVLVGSVLAALPVYRPSYASHENITVEVDNFVYDQGDDVVITGVVDDLDDGEEVEIRILKPSGSDSPDVDFNDETGDFSVVYDVSSNADDGIYTVEVIYGTDKVYSYFLIDEEDDPITVLTGDDMYSAGDDVEISGQVEDIDEVTEVEITVFDPTNDELVDSHDEELNNDEFNYSFDLDSDASHGRYAVLVTYDDIDEGYAIFEVEDEDSGSNDGEPITINVNSSYKPGDTVEIAGEVEDVEQGEDTVEIVVRNPDNDDIVEEDVEIESDGSFEFEFDLADDAEEGDYSIFVSYSGDEVEATFDVSEEGSSSSGLTVSLNKPSYIAGESMIVSGEVPKRITDAIVNIDIFDADGSFVGAFATAEPDSDLSYSATVRLSGELDIDDGYVVKVNYGTYEAEKEFSITGQSSGVSGSAITVTTGSDEYEMGSSIEIMGRIASGFLVDGEKVLIQIKKPDGNPYRIDIVEPSSGGSYTYNVVIGGNLAVVGEYEVIATYGENEATAEFELVGEQGMSAYNLRVEEESYPIEYEITNGEVKSMFVRPGDNKLVISIDASEDGQLVLVLPREVIDATEDGSDREYVVATTDLEAGVGNDNVDIRESDTTDDARTVVIDYEAGTDLIEISGTRVVPEFGAISAIVLAVAIVGIIVATARMQKFSFLK